jgi:tRNA A-37 threonylcarbamoyl transferase component Bud32/tetratricopeptide (TPR) repeat protein
MAEVDAIVSDSARRLDAGGSIDNDSLERAHPELMPELRERLRALLEVSESPRRTLRSLRQAAPPTERGAWLEEDLEFLRRSLDKYEVLERVRFGGQGVVYKARQKGANRLVAIKVLLDGPLASERQRHRFEREVELISRLHHPNIVTMYDTGVVRGRHYFAMEFVEGLPIDDYALLHDLTPVELVQLFTKVCRAVSYAHQNGVIHRDLSPANILVDEQGEPHVFDFGLAKDVWASDEAPAYSFTGQVIGTLHYLSPEQAGGLDGKVDVRSDIYTLGVVLYELLTDGFPYPLSREPRQVRDAILNTDPEPLRKAATRGEGGRMREVDAINRDLETVLVKALAKEKGERYQSAAELADDLERYLRGDAVAARTDSQFYLLRKAIRRHRMAVGVAAIVMAALCATTIAITAFWVQARRERDNAREAARVAYELFDTAMTDLDAAVRPLAGGVAVRDRMMGTLVDQLPQLEALIEPDEALKVIGTHLAERRGDLAYERGERADAALHYSTFLEGVRELAGTEPNRPDHIDSVLRAHRKYATVADEPTQVYERGVQFAAEALRGGPQSGEVCYELAALHAAFGQHLLTLEQYRRAGEQLNAALSLVPEAGDQAADRWDELSADARESRGRVWLQLGDGAAGLADLEASLRIRERLAEARPADALCRYKLMKACTGLATAQRDASRLDEATRLLEKAAESGELLRKMDPTVDQWGFSLYGVRDRLARLYAAAGDMSQAQAECDAAFTLAEELADGYSSRADGRSTLAFAYLLRGQVLAANGEFAQAYAALEQAAEIRESLVESDPNNAGLLDGLAVANSWLGCGSS